MLFLASAQDQDCFFASEEERVAFAAGQELDAGIRLAEVGFEAQRQGAVAFLHPSPRSGGGDGSLSTFLLDRNGVAGNLTARQGHDRHHCHHQLTCAFHGMPLLHGHHAWEDVPLSAYLVSRRSYLVTCARSAMDGEGQEGSEGTGHPY